MVAETDGKDLVLGAENLLQKEFHVLGVALEEFALRIGDVDQQPDAEWQLGLAGQGDDLLRNAVFEYLEGVLVEARDEFAKGVVNAECQRHKMYFGMEDGLLAL